MTCPWSSGYWWKRERGSSVYSRILKLPSLAQLFRGEVRSQMRPSAIFPSFLSQQYFCGKEDITNVQSKGLHPQLLSSLAWPGSIYS